MHPLRAIQSRGLTSYLRLVRKLGEVHVEGEPRESCILPIWKKSLVLGLTVAMDRSDVAVYVLEHLVTDSILATIDELGLGLIRARPDNGYGARAVRDWLREPARKVVITLDGPHGPARHGKPAVARLARIAGVPLYPVHLAAEQWFESADDDRCAMPDIGTRMVATVLPPIAPAGSPENIAEAAARALNRATGLEIAPAPRMHRAPFRAWARACTMPLRFGKVTVGLPTSPLTD